MADEQRYALRITITPDENPCGHTDFDSWVLCGECEKARLAESMKNAHEAGRKWQEEVNRRVWEAFLKALNTP